MSNDLYQRIWQEYQRLTEDTYLILDKDFFINKYDFTGGKVSVANLISYQIGWGNMLINWYENGIKNLDFIIPGEGFDKWDYIKIAQYFYIKYETLSRNELLEEFLKIVTRIIEIAKHESTCLDKTGIWNWCTLKSGKKWPLSKWIRVNTVSPYRRASIIIRKGK